MVVKYVYEGKICVIAVRHAICKACGNGRALHFYSFDAGEDEVCIHVFIEDSSVAEALIDELYDNGKIDITNYKATPDELEFFKWVNN